MTFPIIIGPTESSFEVADIAVDRDRTTARATMAVRSWMCDSRGRLRPGNLGVLVDNVLGYTIIAGAPQGHWAVTTEMWVDVAGSLPTDGSVLRGEAELIDRDATDGYAEARVVDSAGRLLARARQRGRFVSGLPRVDPGAPSASTFDPHSGRRRPVLLQEELTRTDHGFVATLDVDPEVANPNGNLHGGVAMAWSDAAGAAALRKNGAVFATTSVHVAYVRPAPTGARLRVAATLSHQGRSLGLVHVVFSLSDGKPCMFATVTAHAT